MDRLRLSLSSLFCVIACLMLFVIAVYERHRALEIETRAIVANTPEYKAVLKQDWEVMKREIQIQHAINELDVDDSLAGFQVDGGILPIAERRKLANILNARLKLAREKQKLNAMKMQVIQEMLDSSD